MYAVICWKEGTSEFVDSFETSGRGTSPHQSTATSYAKELNQWAETSKEVSVGRSPAPDDHFTVELARDWQ